MRSRDGQELWKAKLPFGRQTSSSWREPQFARDGSRVLLFVGMHGSIVLDLTRGSVLHAHNARRPGIIVGMSSAGDWLLLQTFDRGGDQLHRLPL